jgi:membrane-associated protein
MIQVINTLLSVPGWAAYVIVGLLAFGESAAFIGLVLPGETALLLGGVLAGTGRISLPLILMIAVVAAVGGDSVGYEIGRFGGPAIRAGRAGRFVGERRWVAAERFVQRRGGWAVFLGRWVGLMRALVPAIAGMTRMPYRRFLLFNAAGGAIWSAAVVTGGYLAGASWQRVQGIAGTISLTMTGLTVAAGLVTWLVRTGPRWYPRLRRAAGAIGGQPGLVVRALVAMTLVAAGTAVFADRWS